MEKTLELIAQWYGATPESEGLSPEEFDRLVRVVQKQLKEYREKTMDNC